MPKKKTKLKRKIREDTANVATKIHDNVFATPPVGMEVPTVENVRKVLSYLVNHNQSTVRDISGNTGIREDTVQAICSSRYFKMNTGLGGVYSVLYNRLEILMQS